jgi:hypothetical protein
VEIDSNSFELPKDSESLRALVPALLLERDEQQRRVNEQSKQTGQLQVELVRVKLELERFKKWYSGPRADRLQSSGNLAQLLLNFFEELEHKPVHPDDIPPHAEPEGDPRRVKRRRGRRHLANFADLPITTHVYELSARERACPCCGVERKEIGAEQSWQVEYLPGHFERIHLPARVASPAASIRRLETAAKPESRSTRAWRGPACWPTSLPASSVTICRCIGWRTTDPRYRADSPQKNYLS